MRMLTKEPGKYNVAISSGDRYGSLKKVYLILSTLSGGMLREQEAAMVAAMRTEEISDRDFWGKVEDKTGITPGNRRVICSGLKKKGFLEGKKITQALHILFDDEGNFHISLNFSERPADTGSSEEHDSTAVNGENS